jgi:hypothetical protein
MHRIFAGTLSVFVGLLSVPGQGGAQFLGSFSSAPINSASEPAQDILTRMCFCGAWPDDFAVSSATSEEWGKAASQFKVFEAQYAYLRRSASSSGPLDDAIKLAENSQDPKDRYIAAVLAAKLYGGDTERTRKFALGRSLGVSVKSMELFARAFQLRALVNERKFQEADELSKQLIQKYGLKAQAKELDEFELEFHLSDSTIANSIIFWGNVAAIEQARGGQHWLANAVAYLDVRDNLESVKSLFKQNDWDERLLKDVAKRAAKVFEMPGLADSSIVKAAWVDGAKGYIVLEGRYRHTLQIRLNQTIAGGGGNKKPPPPAALAPPGSPDPKKNSGPHFGGNPNPTPGRNPRPSGGFRGLSSKAFLGISVLAADQAYGAYSKFVEENLKTYSTDAMLLYDVRIADDHASIVLPIDPSWLKQLDVDTKRVKIESDDVVIQLTKEDIDALLGGSSLSPNHPFLAIASAMQNRALVQYTSPFAIPDSAIRDRSAAITFGLQRTAQTTRIYRDPLTEHTDKLVQQLNGRINGSPSDYVALIDDGSFQVDDRRIVANIEQDLRDLGVDVLKYKTGVDLSVLNAGGKNVIIITGHSDHALVDFVDELGKAGALHGNYVMFNSCGTPLTRAGAERMVEQYGAEAVFVYEGSIDAGKVENALVDFGDQLKANPNASLVDTLRTIVHKHQLNGIWTISYLPPLVDEVRYG